MQVDVEKGGHGRVVVSGLQPGRQAERLLETPEGEVGGTQTFSLVSVSVGVVLGDRCRGRLPSIIFSSGWGGAT